MASQYRALNRGHEIEVLVTYLRRSLKGGERENLEQLSKSFARLLGNMEDYGDQERALITGILEVMMTRVPAMILDNLRSTGKFVVVMTGQIDKEGSPQFNFSAN